MRWSGPSLEDRGSGAIARLLRRITIAPRGGVQEEVKVTRQIAKRLGYTPTVVRARGPLNTPHSTPY
jgi:hypothetical protein